MIITNNKKFTDSLVSDPCTYTAQKERKDERFKLAQQIRKKLGEYGKVDVIAGVFGEWKGCDGMVEEVIKPEEGGVFVKIYGCSYLYKGYPDARKVHGLELAKFLMSGVLKDIIGKSFIFSGALIFMFLFARKKFIHYADLLFMGILNRIHWYEIPKNEYNTFVKEIKRAVVVSLKEEHNAWTLLVAKITRFICLFLEMDSAYRFRIQDAFGNVNNSAKNKTKEFFRLLDILISRETAKGIASKWKFIKLVLRGVLLISPSLTRIVKRIISNLDADKIKMDEADWYFCLRYVSYDFGGKDKDWRFNRRDEIDREKGHIFIL